MKALILASSVLICLVAGCITEPQQTTEPRAVNPWLVRTVNDIAIRNSIIRQHTVFPYHFIPDGADLNDLGKRDLDVLISHYKANAGPLNVRQGHVTEELYEARVATILEALAEAGVDANRVEISDLPAGGDGMASEEVLVILQGQE